MTTTLFTGGRVRAHPEAAPADWLLCDDDTVVATGTTAETPAADRTIDLAGAVALPAFCDAHVHLPATGLYALGMDFRGEGSSSAIMNAFAARAKGGGGNGGGGTGGLLFGGNFEDPLDRPLGAADLDAAVGGRTALLARADMHSCIVSSAVLEQLDLDGLAGVDLSEQGEPTGYLREQAAGRAWRWFESQLPAQEQRDAITAAAQLAYSKGVTTVHEMYVVEWRGWPSLDIVRDVAATSALDVVFYVATAEVARVVDMGFERIGGDFFLDGSFGSQTAWLSEPYDAPPPPGSPPRGIAYHTNEEVIELFGSAQAAGLQVGVHAIGDAAITQALDCWEAVAAAAGTEAVRALGHRIEHFECASDEHVRRAALLGLRASVQPAFDAFWGGEHGMYATRVGPRRAAGMNRFKTMLDGGLIVGAGSDSTVTPLDPWLQMAALRAHNLPGQSLSASDALFAHTVGSHRLAGGDARGSLEPSLKADVVVVDRDPLEVDPEALRGTEIIGTWASGRRVWPPGEAEAT